MQARAVESLQPFSLRRVLVAMAQQCPAAVNALLGPLLSPAVAELLTTKFEAADRVLLQDGAHRRQSLAMLLKFVTFEHVFVIGIGDAH